MPDRPRETEHAIVKPVRKARAFGRMALRACRGNNGKDAHADAAVRSPIHRGKN